MYIHMLKELVFQTVGKIYHLELVINHVFFYIIQEILNKPIEEKHIIKPIFKNSNIHKYYTENNNKLNETRYSNRIIKNI